MNHRLKSGAPWIVPNAEFHPFRCFATPLKLMLHFNLILMAIFLIYRGGVQRQNNENCITDPILLKYCGTVRPLSTGFLLHQSHQQNCLELQIWCLKVIWLWSSSISLFIIQGRLTLDGGEILRETLLLNTQLSADPMCSYPS